MLCALFAARIPNVANVVVPFLREQAAALNDETRDLLFPHWAPHVHAFSSRTMQNRIVAALLTLGRCAPHLPAEMILNILSHVS